MKFKIQTKQAGIIIMAAVLCFCFVAGTAFARGRMVLKPVIEMGWQRDSNFHKSDTDTKTVDTYFVKPGITFGYTTPKSRLSLDAWFNYRSYDDQDEVAANQLAADDFDYTEYQFDLGASTTPTDRFSLGIDNLYKQTRDPASADANSNSVDRFKYKINKLTPWMQYRFGEKFGLGLKYTNFITDYSDDAAGEGEDTDEDRGTFTLFYYLTKRTSFDLDYQYWTRTYDKNSSDYDSNQVMVNMKHQVNYLTFGAGAGYQSRDFDKTVPSGDIDKFVWKVSVMGQNPPDAAGIPKHSVYLSFGSNFNDSGSGDTYYGSTRLDARFTYLLLPRLNLTLAGWVQNSDYETSTREDDRWLVSGGLDYLINDYFTVGAELGTEERDSNLAGKDYDNNFVKLGLTFNYDLGSK